MSRLYRTVKAIPAIITPKVMLAAMPTLTHSVAWAKAFNNAIFYYPVRDIAMLLAQVGHESLDLTVLEENLNYSAKRLTQVWPRRYPTLAAAAPYARNPVALANHTYGGRIGNTLLGDGWKFRGRGPIMITGKYNYNQLMHDTQLPVLTHPELLAEDMECGAISACWYFRTRVTAESVLDVTKQIQGGNLGLEDRKERFHRAAQALRRY